MPKISFLITDEDNQKLQEINARYKLGKSDQVRRGIRMLHDYLMKDIEQPVTPPVPVKKAKKPRTPKPKTEDTQQAEGR